MSLLASFGEIAEIRAASKFDVLCVPYRAVYLQLLDLMHTLHTRAAGIYSSWAEEQRHLETAARKITADSRTLWANCWCPLLQGKAIPW